MVEHVFYLTQRDQLFKGDLFRQTKNLTNNLRKYKPSLNA